MIGFLLWFVFSHLSSLFRTYMLMHKSVVLGLMATVMIAVLILLKLVIPVESERISGAPPDGIPESEVPDLDPLAWIRDWQRPDVPPRVGLQVGHMDNQNFPEELARLRGNTGAQGGGKWEWEVNLAIADETKRLLEPYGVEVDILPATVPKQYWADVFMAIHADGSESAITNGYKFGAPWRDLTGKSEHLVSLLEKSYGEETSFSLDPNITRNMRGYYAFAWWRYDHAIHPMTTAVIAETGFLTSPHDRRIIVDQPEVSAAGLANGILEYLRGEGLVE